MNNSLRSSEPLNFERYSNLGFSEYEFKNLYRCMATGNLSIDDRNFQRIINIVIKRGELLNFIQLVHEANKVYNWVKVGQDALVDPLADRYSHSKDICFGYAGVYDKNAKYYVEEFIRKIERKYDYVINAEKKKRQEAHLAFVEEEERLFQPVRDKYEKYLEAYKLWVSKDTYWHRSHTHLIPYPEKFDLTEDELKKCGYYDYEFMEQRANDYQKACSHYQFANPLLKRIFNRRKRIPLSSDYGMTDEQIFEYSGQNVYGYEDYYSDYDVNDYDNIYVGGRSR